MQQFSKDLASLKASRENAAGLGIGFRGNDFGKNAKDYFYSTGFNDVMNSTQGKALIGQVESNVLTNLPTEVKDAIAVVKNRNGELSALKTTLSSANTALLEAKNKYKISASATLAEVKSKYNYKNSDGVNIYEALKAPFESYSSAEKAIFDKFSMVSMARTFLSQSGYGKNLEPFLGADWAVQPKKPASAFNVSTFAMGGMVVPRRFVEGGYASGTDTVPAMLTPGEFVVSQPAVKKFGVDNLKSVNNGTYGGDSVYNYSVNVNVSNAGASANDIAQTVMSQIRQIDAQRIRSNNL